MRNRTRSHVSSLSLPNAHPFLSPFPYRILSPISRASGRGGAWHGRADDEYGGVCRCVALTSTMAMMSSKSLVSVPNVNTTNEFEEYAHYTICAFRLMTSSGC